jgi:hypothetical protein
MNILSNYVKHHRDFEFDIQAFLKILYMPNFWRGDREAEGAALEMLCTPKRGTEGSNPSLSDAFINLFNYSKNLH